MKKRVELREHKRTLARCDKVSILKWVLSFATVVLLTHGLSIQAVRGDGAGVSVAAVAEQELFPPVLPRWREGITLYDPEQSLYPFSIHAHEPMKSLTGTARAPSGQIASPPEYEPVRSVLIPFFWSLSSVVRDCVVALTADPQHDEIAYVLVTDMWNEILATHEFQTGGADMSKVQFISTETDSIWIRDYGPHFIWLDGAMGIVDSHYFPGRDRDNFIPTVLGDEYFFMPTFDMGLYHSGGNFQAGSNRTGFVTSLVTLHNKVSQGFREDFIAELFKQYQGINTLHVMPMLPPSVDGTGHIDMWMYLVDKDSVVISEFKPGSDPSAISITDNAVDYMEGLGYEVYRLPAWNGKRPGVLGWLGFTTHYTYTNGFRVNDRILIPSYGEGNPEYLDEDAEALAAWQAAAGPNVEIIPINSYSIIPLAGALHCIVKQVPRYTESIPASRVMRPSGGELLVSGTTEIISWTATDTDNIAIHHVDLYYSVDGGSTYEYIVTTDDTGYYAWTVPEIRTDQAKIKVVVTSEDFDQAEAVSDDVFEIAPAQQTVYDFTTGAGVYNFALGYKTRNWSILDGNRTPVSKEIDSYISYAYSRLAYSDGTWGEYDQNRYRSPSPGQHYSTHIFELTINEDPAEIDDINILWEGYADGCTQIELYVWDYEEERWGNGAGLFGQNRFIDNWAGNQDGILSGNIRSDFDRYIDASGLMTLLLYAERTNSKTFHDYLAVTVSMITTTDD